MMFWLVAALVVAAVLIPIIRALVAEPVTADPVGADVAFFHAQEAEIDRMAAEGALTVEEAKAARAEAARKLLVKAREAGNAPVGAAARLGWAPVALALAIPAIALPLYLKLGAPGQPDAPFAGRTDISRAEQDMTRLVARLDAHLAESPNDIRGLEIAFPVYMRLGRFEDAASAAERIAASKPQSAEAQANHAEALIFTGSGAVTPDAKAAIDRALALDGKLPRARFYSGLAAEQAGKPGDALAIWRALEADLADGPEKQAVGAQIARLAKPVPASPDAVIPAPNPEAADAIRAMPEAEQKQAIRSMVEGLETRLTQNGGSAEEWQRLVRALAVLGEKPRAGAAIRKALAAHQADPAASATLSGLARELGIEQGAAQ